MAQGTLKHNCIAGLILLAAGLAPAAVTCAHAQQGGKLYRYVDENGRVNYSDRRPDAAGQPVDQLNRQGVVIKRLEAPPTPEQAAEREAAQKKKAEEERKARELARKDEALRGRYGSEKDIDLARADAVAALEQSIRGAEARIVDLSKRNAQVQASAKRYAPDRVPADIRDEMTAIAQEIATQRDLIAKKKTEIDATNVRFEDEKRRYAELMRAGAAAGPN